MQFLVSALRRAFPLLDFYLEIGAAAHALAHMSTVRDDLQIVLYQGQFRIGSAGDHHDDLPMMVGTRYVEPNVDDWQRAVGFAAKAPEGVVR